MTIKTEYEDGNLVELEAKDCTVHIRYDMLGYPIIHILCDGYNTLIEIDNHRRMREKR